MRKFLLCISLLCLGFVALHLRAQNVNVNATLGIGFATYPTLFAAFNKINDGTHRGVITVTVINNTSEGPFGAVLQFSGYQLVTDYTKLTITTSGNYTVTGNPAPGQAVIQLSGADDVIINGTINNGSSGTRNLTIVNASASTNSGVIWLRSAGAFAGCHNDTIKNLNLKGGTAPTPNTFGIFAGGSTISPTGAGSDHDYNLIENNVITRASIGIFYRSNSTGPSSAIIISNNTLGSYSPTDYITFRGMDLQYLVGSLIAGNSVFNILQSGANHISGIEIGNGVSNCTFSANSIYKITNTSPSFYGAYAINLGGTNNILLNNQIFRVLAGSSSNSSNTFNAFGIRINSGTGHKLYYNSVHLYDTIPIAGLNPGISAALCIAATPLAGIDIRNNIFSNKTVGRVNNTKSYGVYTPNAYSFLGSTIANNGYFVPPVGNATTNYYVGANMGYDRQNLFAWKNYTLQDSFSVPLLNQNAPFRNDTNLHIDTTFTPLMVESVGILIPGYSVDFDNEIRQGFPGYSHLPAGIAPDIGMDEVAKTPPDLFGPTPDSVVVSPLGLQCPAVSHTVQAFLRDVSGIASAFISWKRNGVAQTNIPMTFGSGRWTGTIPASGNGYITYQIVSTDLSAFSNVGFTQWFSYQDEYIWATAGPDQTICIGDSVTLYGGTGFDKSIKITEVMLDRSATGTSVSFPAFATGPDLIEITNTGNVSVSLGGYSLFVAGGATAAITFGNSVILPDSSVLIVHVGPGTDIPASFYFNTGGFLNDLQSGEATGVWLTAPNGRIVDAVGVNGFTFPPSGGVLSSDWSGNIPSSFGTAGVSRINGDSNRATDWRVASGAALQNIGSPNIGLTMPYLLTFYWTPTAVTASSISVSPPVTTAYSVTLNDGTCSFTDTATVIVLPHPSIPTTLRDTVCGMDTLHLSATGDSVLTWYDTQFSTIPVNRGPVYDLVIAANDTFWVESNNGACASTRTMVVGIYQPPPMITVSANDSVLCESEQLILSVTSANSAYNYVWSGDNMLQYLGDTVHAFPTYSNWYLVSANDGFCFTADSIHIVLHPNPGVTAISIDSLICIGDTALITTSVFRPLAAIRDFSNMNSMPIPDNNPTGITSNILVSGINHVTLNDSSILSICFSITHPRDGDLTGRLVSPNGDTLTLISNTGGFGANFYNTCFSPSSSTNIFFGTAPFAGSFYPLGPGTFNSFTNTPANGTWQLLLKDNAGTNVGTLNSWSISFQDYNSLGFAWTSSPSGFSSIDSLARPNPVISTRYFVRINDNATNCYGVDSFMVNVNPPLDAIPVAPVGICFGATDTIFATATGGDGNYSFSWNPGAINSDTLIVNLTADTTFYLTVIDGCGTPMNLDSVFIPIAGPVSLSTGNDTVVCFGSDAYLQSIVLGGDGNYAFTWSDGATTRIDTVFVTGPATYFVHVIDGCGASDSDSVSVNVYPDPIVHAPADTIICSGNSVNLITTFVPGHGNHEYLWTPGADTLPNIVVSPQLTLTYVVRIKDDCGQIDTDDVVVTVSPRPVANFTYVINGSGFVQFTNLSLYATSYSWSFGDGGTSAANNAAHIYTGTGLFTVTLIATNMCGSDTVVHTVNLIADDRQNGFGDIPVSIWPNPSNGNFFASLKSEYGEKISLKVISLQGQEMWSKEVTGTGVVSEYTIELPPVAKGFYLFKMNSENMDKVFSILVQ